MNNVYVIYGEDNYMINKEVKAVAASNKIEDIIKYDMATASFNEIIIDASVMSIFDNKKIVVCENSNFLTGTKNIVDEEIEDTTSKINNKNTDELLKYIDNPNPNSILIFTINNSKLDDRKKIVKELKLKAKVIQCLKPTSTDMFQFAKKTFNEKNIKITDDDIKYLLERTTSNYNNLNNEINKLCTYKLDEKIINKNDINVLIKKQIDDDIFALIDSLINNNKDKSFEIYNELIMNGEEPIKVIVMLANQYRLIYQVKELSNQGLSESQIATKLKIHPYRIKLAKEKSYKFTFEQLKNYLEQLADLDYGIKNSKIDKYFGLELFFLKI